MDATIKHLAFVLRRERVERATRLTLDARLSAGGELFDAASAVTLDGIRLQNPQLTEEQVIAELKRRLASRKARELRQLERADAP